MCQFRPNPCSFRSQTTYGFHLDRYSSSQFPSWISTNVSRVVVYQGISGLIFFISLFYAHFVSLSFGSSRRVYSFLLWIFVYLFSYFFYEHSQRDSPVDEPGVTLGHSLEKKESGRLWGSMVRRLKLSYFSGTFCYLFTWTFESFDCAFSDGLILFDCSFGFSSSDSSTGTFLS